MNTPAHISDTDLTRISFFFIVGFLIAVFYFGIGTPLVSVLFSYLMIFYIGKKLPKQLTVVAFSAVIIVLFYCFGRFIAEAVKALPEAANKAVPTVVNYLSIKGITLPFTDTETARTYVTDMLDSQLGIAAKYAQIITKEFVYVIISLVVTCGIFSTKHIDLGRDSYAIKNNLYTALTTKIAERFALFFESFRTVMGAQVVISAVNTFFTGVFLVLLHAFDTPMPYTFVIIVITFLCGLLPIIGNLISNAVIFSIGLTQSAHLAVIALLYLIILHKFEYFLNSRIIGGRIKNPMWLTLLGLLIGERLGGIPGMILAPVILNYLKIEGARVSLDKPTYCNN
jgi:predicted PurR-regulated permease PerM